MSTETPARSRLIITIVLVLFAVAILFVEPLLVKQVLPQVIAGQQARFDKLSASEKPEDKVTAALIEDTPYLVSLFFTIWMGLAVVGAMVFLVTSRAFYRSEKWAKGLALLCFAMPSMGGAYMLVPTINFIGFGVPVVFTMIIALLGLIPYFTIVLSGKAALGQKIHDFFLFLALGVSAAHSFSNAHAALRVQWMHPARPAWPEGTWVLWLGPQTMWWGTIFLILAIYFLGVRSKAGWYLAVIGGAILVFTNLWIHFVRGTTSDYILGAALGLLVLILTLVPAFKKRLFD